MRTVVWSVALLALLAWFGHFAWLRLTLRATGGFDADKIMYELTKPPPGKNVEAALEELLTDMPVEPYFRFDIMAALSGEWDPVSRPALADVIHYLELPETVRWLDRLHEISWGSTPYRGGGMPYALYRRLCKLSTTSVRYAAEQEAIPFDSAIRDVESGLNLARILYDHQMLVGCLIGFSCEALVVTEMTHLAGAPQPDAEQLRRLLACFQRCRLPQRLDMRSLAETDRLCTRQRLAQTYVVREDGNGWLDLASIAGVPAFGKGVGTNTQAPMWRLANLLSPVFYDYRTVEERFSRLYDAYAAADGMSGPEGLAAVRAADRQVETLSPLHGPIYEETFPRERAYIMGLANLTAREATKAIIALRIHQLEHGGRLPDTLSDLVPDPLPAAPLDWFSDEPLVYRRESNDFVLYSVGVNGIDDGGEASDTGSSGHWPDDGDHLFPGTRREANDKWIMRERPEDPWKDYDPYPGNSVEDYSDDSADDE